MDHFRERAEFLQKLFRQRLGVAPRQRREQRHFQQLVVAQRIRARAEEALAQPLAMAVIMRLFDGFFLRAGRLAGHRARSMPRHTGFATLKCLPDGQFRM